MAHGTVSGYDVERERFHLDVPEYFNFAGDVVERWAEDAAKRALLWVDERGHKQDLTFRHVATRSARLADGLRRLGVKKGDRVLVIIPPDPPWWETFMALIRLGAIAVPGTSQLTARDIRTRMDFSEATAVIADEATAAKVDEALADRQTTRIAVGQREGWHAYEDVLSSASENPTFERTRSDDPAILYFTSGTTGMPKGVLHSDNTLLATARMMARDWRLERTVLYSLSPLSHNHGFGAVEMALHLCDCNT